MCIRDRVTADFAPKVKNSLIQVEDIQDSVENILIKAGYADVAKGYILYRKQREKIRNLHSTICLLYTSPSFSIGRLSGLKL